MAHSFVFIFQLAQNSGRRVLFIGFPTRSYRPYDSAFLSTPILITELFYPAEAMNWWVIKRISNEYQKDLRKIQLTAGVVEAGYSFIIKNNS